MEELQSVVQNYAWGKRGRASFVAQLKEGASAAYDVQETQTYAELWMGTHPNGPARILRDGKAEELLSEWLKAHPTATTKTKDGELPFLFKVLSVEKALSIQAHPDQKLAKTLHAKFPDIYKDANHKPEMTIALTRFEALCQFRPIDEIVAHLLTVPELRLLVDSDAMNLLILRRDQASLREFFRSFIHAEHQTIATQIASIKRRLGDRPAHVLQPVESLVLRLIAEYSDDIGCFCPFLMNYITLQPGEAVFLGANEPHAYLSGDCVECMACSDNVVRAGLTPKFIDKATLYEMLTYLPATPAILHGERIDDVARIYSPPVPEFEVEALNITPGKSYRLSQRTGPSLLLITSGNGVARHRGKKSREFKVTKGQVYLIAANEAVEIVTASDAKGSLSAFRAFPNERVSRRAD
ncbi:hypothetical protein Poli38472_001546 [Pythium oligandrum]|uniref:mannose-6-phosphate isomerase n=1 Tax=Pythium oligandrum TaxID=41045 RepID=A0A8K1FMI2_PYTOL|nr:hypothetical protein Poli38472_001546 [Pythium oligandrum]|eukprot:TMW69390.1 hypothetical protein Poli38472_001546 [Pythium oligandrum]